MAWYAPFQSPPWPPPPFPHDENGNPLGPLPGMEPPPFAQNIVGAVAAVQGIPTGPGGTILPVTNNQTGATGTLTTPETFVTVPQFNAAIAQIRAALGALGGQSPVGPSYFPGGPGGFGFGGDMGSMFPLMIILFVVVLFLVPGLGLTTGLLSNPLILILLVLMIPMFMSGSGGGGFDMGAMFQGNGMFLMLLLVAFVVVILLP